MTRALVLALSLCSSPLLAQQSLVGVWQLSYPGAIRVENGSVNTIMATGTLTISSEGDSLVGVLVADPMPNVQARGPVRMTAPTATDNATFISQSKGVFNANGSEREIISVSTWKLSAKDDIMEGTVERRVQGMGLASQGPQALTGKRRP